MKRIIANKVYDTTTARRIARDSGGEGLQAWEETLYQKRTGEHFLACSGGAMTRYAKRTGENSWTGGSTITPCTYEQAREWAEAHMTAEDYARAFGEPDEDSGRVALNLWIPATIDAKLRRKAAETGRNITQCVIDALEAYVI